jgi:hypothetical protein
MGSAAGPPPPPPVTKITQYPPVNETSAELIFERANFAGNELQFLCYGELYLRDDIEPCILLTLIP